MRLLARLAHILGLVLLLGSILTFVVASSVGEKGDVVELAVARRIISAGTTSLTLPGLALLVVSGAALLGMDPRVLRRTPVRVMVVAIAGIVVNGVVVVLPAVRSATALAEASLAAGHRVAGYQQAYMTESVAGGINVVLVLAALIAGVFGFGTARRSRLAGDEREAIVSS